MLTEQSPVARPTVAQRFDARHNSVNALRLFLAGLVLVSHTIQDSTGGPDPVGWLTGSHVDLGTIAVDGFFALSGFLIAGSYLHSPSVWRYLWRRALRILPGFYVCLIVSAAVIAPLAWVLEHGHLAGFPLLGDTSATSYVWRNAGLFINQFYIADAFEGEAVNGSLYTLFYEFFCYLLIAVIGVAGVLTRRAWAMVAIFILVWVLMFTEAVADTGLVLGHPTREILLRFGTMFLAGTLALLYADRIGLTARGGILAGLTLVAALLICVPIENEARSELTYSLLAPPAVAYLVLLTGSSRRLTRIGSRRDLSYGLYVYAWPVQATLLVLGAASWWLPLYLAVSLAIAMALAFLSWTFVEAPALALKSWTPQALMPQSHERPAAPPASPADRTDEQNGV
jgi:peptidoglycan/LPS O-acetylase OafA/YrhL